MGIFLAIAWRNLWRNTQRSLIMIAGIAVGLFGLLVYYGISNGFLDEIVENAIELDLGHIQVTRRGWLKNPVPGNSFSADSLFVTQVARAEGVTGAAGRFQAEVLINSTRKSSRLDLLGIDPGRERKVTSVAAHLVEGSYLDPGDNNHIVLGEDLARTLDVGIGGKVVVMAQDTHNELQSVLFRVSGIFRTAAPSFDKSAAFVSLEAVRGLLGRPGQYTAILVRVKDRTTAAAVASELRDTLRARHPELSVDTWWEASPLLAQSIQMFNEFIWIFYLIIYLAMAFGVINIMLMAVLDRTREIGIMRAVGTTPGQVRIVVLGEAALLGLAGILVGGAAAWLLNGYLATHGLDLSRWSSAMSFMGISNVVHSHITGLQWALSFLSAEAAVIVASLWPAWRASRLSPVKAVEFR